MEHSLFLFISPQFRPIVGGYERAAERLATGLADVGHSVLVLTERRDVTWPREEPRGGFLIQRWWCIYRPRFHIATSLIGMLSLLVTVGMRAKVWHVHQYGRHAAVAIAMAALCRSSVVLKLTSSGVDGIGSTNARMSMLGRFTKKLLLRANAVVATTDELAAEARAYGYPLERIHLIGNAVDTSAFSPARAGERRNVRAALPIANRPTAIAVGRLAHEKNFELLIRAWHRQSSAGLTDWQLVVVGDGAERSALQTLIDQLGVGDCVRLIGARSDLPLWYRAADLYVSSSDYEGLSNTLLEAMSSGLPVVVTAVSGTAALVGQTGAGIVVPVGDEQALADAMGAIAGDLNRAEEMGRRARSSVEHRYSVEAVTEAHLELYAHLIEKRRKGSA
jgi:glycosyltransferase involved in cell wall biosynthesis